ncbi:hypothetical protein RGUI_3837 [Rhodovulum sp. P5]|nr:hypothetical protein RGUI_3837 [Rhodovulum sp. P5]
MRLSHLCWFGHGPGALRSRSTTSCRSSRCPSPSVTLRPRGTAPPFKGVSCG